ncbi:MAG: NMD3-related protein [Candidatus Thorarchaeota archaeon]
MPNRFCAICGKDLDENAPNYGMCLKCYLKENPLFKLPGKLSIKICLDCGSYSQRKVWIEPESNEIFFIIEDSIRRFVLKPYSKKNNIDFSFFFDQESFVYSSKDLLKSLISMVRGTLKSDNKITYQEKINVNLNYDLCKTCSNLRGGTYFLSIIQLRVKDETYFNLIKEVLDEIHIYVEKLNEKDRKQYISKIEDQKFGVDLYLSTNELMNYIIKFLKSNYHFILKRSKKLVGRDSQKGRNLYRLKSLIKFLPINKNDIILIDNQKYIVENLSKNKVLLRSEQGTKIIKEYPYFFSNMILIKNRTEE